MKYISFFFVAIYKFIKIFFLILILVYKKTLGIIFNFIFQVVFAFLSPQYLVPIPFFSEQTYFKDIIALDFFNYFNWFVMSFFIVFVLEELYQFFDERYPNGDSYFHIFFDDILSGSRYQIFVDDDSDDNFGSIDESETDQEILGDAMDDDIRKGRTFYYISKKNLAKNYPLGHLDYTTNIEPYFLPDEDEEEESEGISHEEHNNYWLLFLYLLMGFAWHQSLSGETKLGTRFSYMTFGFTNGAPTFTVKSYARIVIPHVVRSFIGFFGLEQIVLRASIFERTYKKFERMAESRGLFYTKIAYYYTVFRNAIVMFFVRWGIYFKLPWFEKLKAERANLDILDDRAWTFYLNKAYNNKYTPPRNTVSLNYWMGLPTELMGSLISLEEFEDYQQQIKKHLGKDYYLFKQYWSYMTYLTENSSVFNTIRHYKLNYPYNIKKMRKQRSAEAYQTLMVAHMNALARPILTQWLESWYWHVFRVHNIGQDIASKNVKFSDFEIPAKKKVMPETWSKAKKNLYYNYIQPYLTNTGIYAILKPAARFVTEHTIINPAYIRLAKDLPESEYVFDLLCRNWLFFHATQSDVSPKTLRYLQRQAVSYLYEHIDLHRKAVGALRGKTSLLGFKKLLSKELFIETGLKVIQKMRKDLNLYPNFYQTNLYDPKNSGNGDNSSLVKFYIYQYHLHTFTEWYLSCLFRDAKAIKNYWRLYKPYRREIVSLLESSKKFRYAGHNPYHWWGALRVASDQYRNLSYMIPYTRYYYNKWATDYNAPYRYLLWKNFYNVSMTPVFPNSAEDFSKFDLGSGSLFFPIFKQWVPPRYFVDNEFRVKYYNYQKYLNSRGIKLRVSIFMLDEMNEVIKFPEAYRYKVYVDSLIYNDFKAGKLNNDLKQYDHPHMFYYGYYDDSVNRQTKVQAPQLYRPDINYDFNKKKLNMNNFYILENFQRLPGNYPKRTDLRFVTKYGKVIPLEELERRKAVVDNLKKYGQIPKNVLFWNFLIKKLGQAVDKRFLDARSSFVIPYVNPYSRYLVHPYAIMTEMDQRHRLFEYRRLIRSITVNRRLKKYMKTKGFDRKPQVFENMPLRCDNFKEFPDTIQKKFVLNFTAKEQVYRKKMQEKLNNPKFRKKAEQYLARIQELEKIPRHKLSNKDYFFLSDFYKRIDKLIVKKYKKFQQMPDFADKIAADRNINNILRGLSHAERKAFLQKYLTPESLHYFNYIYKNLPDLKLNFKRTKFIVPRSTYFSHYKRSASLEERLHLYNLLSIAYRGKPLTKVRLRCSLFYEYLYIWLYKKITGYNYNLKSRNFFAYVFKEWVTMMRNFFFFVSNFFKFFLNSLSDKILPIISFFTRRVIYDKKELVTDQQEKDLSVSDKRQGIQPGDTAIRTNWFVVFRDLFRLEFFKKSKRRARRRRLKRKFFKVRRIRKFRYWRRNTPPRKVGKYKKKSKFSYRYNYSMLLFLFRKLPTPLVRDIIRYRKKFYRPSEKTLMTVGLLHGDNIIKLNSLFVPRSTSFYGSRNGKPFSRKNKPLTRYFKKKKFSVSPTKRLGRPFNNRMHDKTLNSFMYSKNQLLLNRNRTSQDWEGGRYAIPDGRFFMEFSKRKLRRKNYFLWKHNDWVNNVNQVNNLFVKYKASLDNKEYDNYLVGAPYVRFKNPSTPFAFDITSKSAWGQYFKSIFSYSDWSNYINSGFVSKNNQYTFFIFNISNIWSFVKLGWLVNRNTLPNIRDPFFKTPSSNYENIARDPHRLKFFPYKPAVNQNIINYFLTNFRRSHLSRLFLQNYTQHTTYKPFNYRHFNMHWRPRMEISDAIMYSLLEPFDWNEMYFDGQYLQSRKKHSVKIFWSQLLRDKETGQIVPAPWGNYQGTLDECMDVLEDPHFDATHEKFYENLYYLYHNKNFIRKFYRKPGLYPVPELQNISWQDGYNLTYRKGNSTVDGNYSAYFIDLFFDVGYNAYYFHYIPKFFTLKYLTPIVRHKMLNNHSVSSIDRFRKRDIYWGTKVERFELRDRFNYLVDRMQEKAGHYNLFWYNLGAKQTLDFFNPYAAKPTGLPETPSKYGELYTSLYKDHKQLDILVPELDFDGSTTFKNILRYYNYFAYKKYYKNTPVSFIKMVLGYNRVLRTRLNDPYNILASWFLEHDSSGSRQRFYVYRKTQKPGLPTSQWTYYKFPNIAELIDIYFMSNNKLRQSSINFLTGNPYLDNSNGRLNKLNYLNIDQNVLPLRTRKNDMIHRTVFGMEDPFIRNRYYDNYSYIPKDFYNRYLQQIIFRRNSIIEFPLFNSNYIVNTRKTRFYRKGSSGSRDDLFYFAQHNDPVQIYLGQLQAHDFWIKQNLYNTFPTNTSTIVEATSSNVNDFATILEFSFKQTDTNIAAYELAAIDFYSSVGILLFFFIFFLFKFKLTVFFPRIYLQQMQKKINASLSLIKKNNFMLFLPTIYRNIDDTTNIHDIKISFKLASVIKFFPDPATALAESIWDFHNDLMFYLIAIVGLVMMLLVFILFYFWLPLKNRLVFRKNYFVELKNVYQAKNSPGADFTYRLSKPYPIIVPSKKNYDVKLEIVLTIVPALILVAIMIPSFALLYSMDEILVSHYTIRVIGHQWYWSYEYAVTKNPRLLFEEKLSIFKWINLCNYGFKPFYERLGLYQSDKEDVDAYVTMFQIYAQYKKPFVRALRRIHLAFDSTMIPTEDLKRGNLRLLEVSLSPRLLVNKVGRILVTSDDVLHSWAIPAFGIKIDACPGRLNQVTVLPERTGVFYGQCSEICGVNHGFMPISVRVVQYSDFMFFLSLWKTGRAKLPNLW